MREEGSGEKNVSRKDFLVTYWEGKDMEVWPVLSNAGWLLIHCIYLFF